MTNDWHVKYRPKSLNEVVGQDAVIKSIRTLVDEATLKITTHSFLLTGSSGVGKTTIARILAKMTGCDKHGIIEINASDKTGVDDMRALIDGLYMPTLGKSSAKFVILDEAHKLTSNAFDAMLKILEEPPSHVYFTLCTTEPAKIPKTIWTRCHTYNLKDLHVDTIIDTLESIVKQEKLKLNDKCLDVIAREAKGSMRQAIMFLSQARDCRNIEEVSAAINSPIGTTEIIDLCRLIKDNARWDRVIKVLNKLKSTNPESIRIVVANYLTACVLSANTERSATHYLKLLNNFSKPAYGYYDIVLDVADCVIREES